MQLYKNPKSLETHLANFHSNRARSYCNICNKTFATERSLQGHRITAHTATPRPRLPCSFPWCGKSYLNKFAVASHIRMEHSQNPTVFRCTLCSKEFKCRKNLSIHIAIHTTEKPYKCIKCGKGFAQEGNFKIHQVNLKGSFVRIFYNMNSYNILIILTIIYLQMNTWKLKVPKRIWDSLKKLIKN